MELLLGCGTNKQKRLWIDGDKEWKQVVTLDIDPGVHPDVEFNLSFLGYGRKLPWETNTFDELHAYDVLEHVGTQGHYKAFFNEFSEYYRVLKPGALFYIIVPIHKSMWAWGDPGHTRVFSQGTWGFLSQAAYAAEVGVSAMTDYRDYWKGDFQVVHYDEQGHSAHIILKTIKENNAS